MYFKYYWSFLSFKDKCVVVVGNLVLGYDVSIECVGVVKFFVYVLWWLRLRWDGDYLFLGIVWKFIILEYCLDGWVIFVDGIWFDDVDVVVYCIGYKVLFLFWNEKVNGSVFWDYDLNKL